MEPAVIVGAREYSCARARGSLALAVEARGEGDRRMSCGVGGVGTPDETDGYPLGATERAIGDAVAAVLGGGGLGGQ